ncbi:MAG: hypothetical protein K0R09_2186 [Clostridiales bacterium]|nr:hypothetical protein [Clostridiales bacterium]
MNEEVLRILRMVEEGKINSEKASELIEALGAPQIQKNAVNYGERMLRVKVNSHDGDDVNINIPIKFVKGMLGSVGKLSFGGENGVDKIDPQLISEAIDENLVGKIVDIKSSDGDIVEVFID